MLTMTFEGRPGDRYDKIKAIKAFRLLTKCGLKEAKEAIERTVDTAGAADLEHRVMAEGSDLTQALADLHGHGFTVNSGYAQLIQALDDALKYAAQEKKYAVARNILDSLRDLGVE